jgi:hypothetical protein
MRHARRGLPKDRKPYVAGVHASANKSFDGLAVTSCHAYVLGYDHAPRPNRLFISREAQGATSEIVEVGNLSSRKQARWNSQTSLTGPVNRLAVAKRCRIVVSLSLGSNLLKPVGR